MVMITMTVIAKVLPEKQEEFLQTIRSLKSDTDKKVSSRKSRFYQEVDDRTAFSLIYEFGAKEDLKEFLRTEEFRLLLGAFKVLCEKSKIRSKYNCRNWPRHACATHEAYRRPLGPVKIQKRSKN